jgi:hypothetical protein
MPVMIADEAKMTKLLSARRARAIFPSKNPLLVSMTVSPELQCDELFKVPG